MASGRAPRDPGPAALSDAQAQSPARTPSAQKPAEESCLKKRPRAQGAAAHAPRAALPPETKPLQSPRDPQGQPRPRRDTKV